MLPAGVPAPCARRIPDRGRAYPAPAQGPRRCLLFLHRPETLLHQGEYLELIIILETTFTYPSKASFILLIFWQLSSTERLVIYEDDDDLTLFIHLFINIIYYFSLFTYHINKSVHPTTGCQTFFSYSQWVGLLNLLRLMLILLSNICSCCF